MGDLLGLAFVAAIVISAFAVALRSARIEHEQAGIRRRGIELEAEILARYEAGALLGSELAKARQRLMVSWDPYELELRYVVDGREVVSRGGSRPRRSSARGR